MFDVYMRSYWVYFDFANRIGFKSKHKFLRGKLYITQF